jgi:hypothetical protein
MLLQVRQLVLGWRGDARAWKKSWVGGIKDKRVYLILMGRVRALQPELWRQHQG